MANPKPTHKSVYFMRSIRVQRSAIAGLPSANEGESLIVICPRGERKKLLTDVATDLIVAGSVCEDNALNKQRIEEDFAMATEERANEKRRLEAKAKARKASTQNLIAA